MMFQADTLKTISGDYVRVLKQSNSPLAGSSILQMFTAVEQVLLQVKSHN